MTPHVTGEVPGLDGLHFLDNDLVALARPVLCDNVRASREFTSPDRASGEI